MNKADSLPITAFVHSILIMVIKVVCDCLLAAPNLIFFLCLIIYFIIILFMEKK